MSTAMAADGKDKIQSEDETSELDDIELDKLVSDSKPASTVRSTKWGIKKLQNWLQKRNIECDLSTVAPSDLNTVLRRFYGEVKSEKG